MNILIPHQWLLEHLETNASPEEIQEQVSLCGPSVERIYNIEGDQVYDIEVTTNRVDSMSVRGIAREAAVILNRSGYKSSLKPLKLPANLEKLEQQEDPGSKKLPLPKIKNQTQLVNRVLGVVLTNAKASPTPDWMARRLKQIDVNVHHSLIDITNYITHDLGHPCHAFDYDKIMELGGEIIVKQAQPGKKFITLDGEEHQTVGGEIVFENPAGEIIDLPAVKGTMNTGVTNQTQNVLLWIENLEAKQVRHASMSHAIRTVAAQLNEKGVDPHLAETVLISGIKMYQDLCQAQIGSQIYDDFIKENIPEPVEVKLETIDNYLGLSLEEQEIKQILEKLGCKVESIQIKTKPGLKVQPPTFRPDLKIPADIIEEIARIYGYHQLPSKLMAGTIPTQKPTQTNFELEDRVKHYLANIGWQEVYTYSMVSQELAQQSGYDLEEHLKLENPLTEDRVYLRRSLLPSLEEAVAANPNADKLSFYELTNVYHPRENQIPKHEMRIGLVSTKNYQEVRGEVEALLRQFYIEDLVVEEIKSKAEGSIFTQQAKLVAAMNKYRQEEQILGEIYVLQNGHIGASLSYSQLLKTARKYPRYQPLAKTSPIIEDLTFTLPEKTAVGRVIDQIKAVTELIESVELVDVYQQNYSFRIKYWDRQQNLTNEQVKPLREKLVKTIEEEFNGKLVGQVG